MLCLWYVPYIKPTNYGCTDARDSGSDLNSASWARRAPGCFAGRLGEVAPAALGALGDKDAAAHAAMWDMLLSFVAAYPGAWAAVDARKTVLPRLLALLRRESPGTALILGGQGSGSTGKIMTRCCVIACSDGCPRYKRGAAGHAPLQQ